MDITEFWKLIDKTREDTGGDAQKQSDLLTEELAKLHEEEIISFDQIFDDLKDRAYIGNLWDAATVIMYGCSDSGFEDFREWLVGRGKEAYENAIKDPETLIDVMEVGEQIFPTLLGPAMEAYEKVSGKNMPPMRRERAQLHGRPTINIDAEESELLAEISARCPKLTAKFWEWWTRDKVYSEVREILRETLLPLGFREEEIKGLGTINFKREPLLVKFVLDYYVPDYTLYTSSVERERKYPAAILMYFLPNEYNEEMKSAVGVILQQWLTIAEQHNLDK
jgi:hypothetical protein